MPKKLKQKKVTKQALPKGLASRGLKQKQKQNVNVKQNVKVVVGDIRKKRAARATWNNNKPAAKPPIVLNISNPQPQNNMFMEYFRQQLQNQQPIHAPTLNQAVKQQEMEENKASRAGALHKLDQEPNDVARALRSQAAETRAAMERAEAQRHQQYDEVASSVKKAKRNKTPKRKTVLRLVDNEDENPFTHIADQEQESEGQVNMRNAMEQQQNQMEEAIGASSGENEEDVTYQTPPKQGGAGGNKRGRKATDLATPQPGSSADTLLQALSKYNEEQLQEKLKGKKVMTYMKLLGMRTHMRGNSNPIDAQQRRDAIIGLVINYKRDKGMEK